MSYWIVQCNPEAFDLLPYLKNHGDKPDRWVVSVPRYEKELTVGDVVFIWKSAGSEGRRGIYGVGKVTARPGENAQFPPYGDHYWKDQIEKRRLEPLPWVDVRYRKLILDNPVLDAELTARGLGGLLILRMPRRGIYKLTEQEGNTLQQLVDQR